MHACSTQIASTIGKFGLREGIAPSNGDMHLQVEQIASETSDIRASGTASQTGEF